jgi:hypothetical protein
MPAFEFELSRAAMINLLSAQAEIDAAPDYAAVVRVLYRVEQAERSLGLFASERAPEEVSNTPASCGPAWRFPSLQGQEKGGHFGPHFD